MVDLERRQIVLRGRSYPVTRFDVWWHAEGLGLYADLQEALEQNRPVQPVSVAIGPDAMYEVMS
jgi:hypothetical protein